MLSIILLVVGIFVLIKGADFFVEGASSIAGVFKIPSIVVGLTIVSLGTSMPEAAVSVVAAFAGSNDIAISNVVGSNIFNLLVVLGMTALFTKINVSKSVVKKDFPFLIAITVLILLLFVFDLKLQWYDGVLLLCIMIGYLIYLVAHALQQKDHLEVEEVKHSTLVSIGMMILGIAMIVFGGDAVVNGAKTIALSFGMSEKLVGLTIVSIGTSLPELVTSMVAAKKGKIDIAVGNAVGSNIFNILFILGLSSSISFISVNPAIIIDGVFMLLVTLLCFALAFFRKNLCKKEGLLLLTVFVSYLIYIIIRN